MAAKFDLNTFLRFALCCSVLLVNMRHLDCFLMRLEEQDDGMLNVPLENWDLSCTGLWMGNGPKRTAISSKPISVDVVVSYCRYPLSWLSTELSNLPSFISVRKVFVYSKCGLPVSEAPDGYSLTTLENIGRCDHTYAYHNKQLCSSRKSMGSDSVADVVLFVKDHNWKHQIGSFRSFADMLDIAAGPLGFSCRVVDEETSTFSDFQALREFKLNDDYYNGMRLDKAPYANLNSWLTALNISMPSVVPTCYGGFFAARPESICNGHPWDAIAASLSRGDNIEEGHYMERTWSGMIMETDESLRQHVLCQSTTRPWNPYEPGLLGGCNASAQCS
eukprot:TRINITY_DN6876_c0_g3_i1.p1 TRINITY_DN6876_c0_g3~~TRINITY_DN6876_c0_g3_i1.p1  ORF type:complete len:357 (-),score=34.76 TRINITY_DN6876_c0_g3_i1:280-1278(-)